MGWQDDPVVEDTARPWDRDPEIGQTPPPQPEKSNFWSSKPGRFLYGVSEPIIGAGQLASHLTGLGKNYMDQLAEQEATSYAKSREAAGIKPEDWDYWAGAGNIASPINWVPGGVVGRVAGPAKSLLGAAGRGLAAGAGLGVLQPVTGLKEGEDYVTRTAENAGMGMVLGGAGGAGTELLARGISPVVSRAAKMLHDEGVRLTPGQAGGLAAKRTEDVFERLPLVGTSITEARERAISDFNRAAANRALSPIGETLPESVSAGHTMVRYLTDKFDDAYRDVHSRMNMSMDAPLKNDINNIYNSAKRLLDKYQENNLQKIIVTEIDERLARNGGVIGGEDIQAITSELRNAANGYMNESSYNSKRFGNVLFDVAEVFNDALERQNPSAYSRLQSVNEGYAMFARIRQAASSTASQAREGIFTPTQLGVAVRAGDRTVGRGASARGEALMQDLAEAGRQVLPASLSSSGTAERALTHAALGIGGGGLTLGLPGAIAMGAIPAAYSDLGQSFLRTLMLRRPAGAERAANLVRRYSPFGFGVEQVNGVPGGIAGPAGGQTPPLGGGPGGGGTSPGGRGPGGGWPGGQTPPWAIPPGGPNIPPTQPGGTPLIPSPQPVKPARTPRKPRATAETTPTEPVEAKLPEEGAETNLKTAARSEADLQKQIEQYADLRSVADREGNHGAWWYWQKMASDKSFRKFAETHPAKTEEEFKKTLVDYYYRPSKLSISDKAPEVVKRWYSQMHNTAPAAVRQEAIRPDINEILNEPHNVTPARVEKSVTQYGDFAVGDTVKPVQPFGMEGQPTTIKELLMQNEPVIKRAAPGSGVASKTEIEAVPYARLENDALIKLSQLKRAEASVPAKVLETTGGKYQELNDEIIRLKNSSRKTIDKNMTYKDFVQSVLGQLGTEDSGIKTIHKMVTHLKEQNVSYNEMIEAIKAITRGKD